MKPKKKQWKFWAMISKKGRFPRGMPNHMIYTSEGAILADRDSDRRDESRNRNWSLKQITVTVDEE